MTVFLVTRKSDGVELFRYEAEVPIEWQGMTFDTTDHTAMPPPVEPPQPEPTLESVRTTKLAFRNRFTQTEKVTIEMASADNPSATLQQRQLAASLRATLADQRDASHIDISQGTASGLQTRAGVHALEALGLIAPGRAAEILDTPPAAHEVFHG